MKTLLTGAAALSLSAMTMTMASPAHAACGEVSIAEMNWASAAVVVSVSKFLMEQGYGCDVTVVPSDTTPAVTSLAENGEPDIVPEMWVNSAGDAYKKLKETGKIVELANVLDPGGVEGWWLPTYLVEEHPELKTIEGVMANPDLVGGMFNDCPDGWGCRITSDNLIRALDLESKGFEIFYHGSGETLATSMASAYQDRKPWFGYYWGPTVPLGKYDMTSIDLGPFNEEAYLNNQNKDTPNPGVTSFAAAPVLTVVTKDFNTTHPEIAALMSKVTFKTDAMSKLLAWKDENNASSEETAVYFLTENKDVWADWLSDDAKAKLSKILQ
jgi:glycine betaine/proline transport system substrate-binding protein